MWVLFILLLNVNGAVVSTTPLAGYPVEGYPDAHAECMSEAKRVQAEMEKSYPNDKEKFRLECWIKVKETT